MAILAKGWKTGGWSSSPGKVKNFHFSISSRLDPRPIQFLMQRVLGDLSLGVQRPGSETEHLPPTGAEEMKTWIYTAIPPYAFMS
jgi:hypothetical protein